MSGLSRTPGKRVYGESRTAGSNPALSASYGNIPRNATRTPGRQMRDWLEESLAVFVRSTKTQICIVAGLFSFALFMIGGDYFAKSFEFRSAPAGVVDAIRLKIMHRYDNAAWIALATFLLLAVKSYREDRKRLLDL
jgi:hypothetical protein